MVNLNVRYQRGNYALQTLTKEITTLWGYPARPYEYVTGYLAADNYTGHNADANGVVHGVDIFVGAGSLTNAQADVLTKFLRAEGLAGDIPGHPDRLYYIIYQDRIAGDFSNWEWVGAGYGHWDHVHVSTCDLFWGDPAPISALDYDSTAPWGLNGLTPQANKITRIQEDELSAAEVNTIMAGIASTEKGLRDYINAHMLGGTNSADGWRPGATKIVIENQRRINTANANIAALTEALNQLAKSKGVTIDYAKIDASIKAALADGVELTVAVKK